MVLNTKIEQARIKYNSFIPYTDGKGPILRLNLRRLKKDKIIRMFNAKDDSKINK